MATETALSTCLYGDPKTGKSLAVIWAAPDAAYMGPKESAIVLPAESMLGYRPSFTPVLLISQIPVIAWEAKKRGFRKVVVDDLSHLAANTELWHKSQPYGGNNFKVWGAVRADLQTMVYQVCNVLGMTAFFTAHEKAAQAADPATGKKAMRGGPKLPSGFQEDLPSYMDLVYRVQHSGSSPRGLVKYGWPYIIRAGGGDLDYTAGDRFNVAPDCANLNLGEVFRHFNGGTIADQFRRPAPWHDWIEGAVEHYSKQVATNEKDLAVVSDINRELIKVGLEAFKGDRRPVQWALNDTLARAYLRVHSRQADPWQAFMGMGNLSSVPVVAPVQSGPDLTAMAGAAPPPTK